MLFFYAFLGGLLPALLWLWFFLREDAKHPEPKWLILAAFLSGMLAVIIVLPIEVYTKCFAASEWPEAWWRVGDTLRFCNSLTGENPILLWAAAEELVKYLVAVAVILWRRAVDEPIDAMIYLITVALGFAALETGLYLMGPLGRGDIIESIIMGDMRFMGAALLHTVSSAVVGFFCALTFYRSMVAQFYALCAGLILAVLLHALFNHHIMTSTAQYGNVQIAFFSVWLGVIALFSLFERAKRITRPLP